MYYLNAPRRSKLSTPRGVEGERVEGDVQQRGQDAGGGAQPAWLGELYDLMKSHGYLSNEWN